MSKPKAAILGTCMASLLFIFTGCDLLGGDAATGEIKLSSENPTEVTVGESIALKGTLEASEKISKVQYILYDNDGNQNPTGINYELNNDAEQDDEKKVDLEKAELKIVTSASLTTIACSGTYSLRIEVAVEDGVVADHNFEFTVKGPECKDGAIVSDLETSTVTVGAQKATTGSSIDLDAFKVYKLAEAKGISEDIDLFFGKLNGGPTLMSPKAAETNSFNISDWETKNDTKLLDVQISLSSIESSYQIEGLWKDENLKSSLVISEGKTIIVKTDKGAIKVVEISEMDDESDSMEIKITTIKKKS